MLDETVQDTLTKEEYQAAIDERRTRLSVLQQRARTAGLPVAVVFEGWGCAGKGDVLSSLLSYLDPRGFRMYNLEAGRNKKQSFFRQYGRHTPAAGKMAIYDRSWYRELTSAYRHGDDDGAACCLRTIDIFERQLTDGGTLLFKFFLHIGKKEQKRRLKKLLEKRSTAWRISGNDVRQNKHYDKYSAAIDRLLSETSRPGAEWTVIGANDIRSAKLKVYDALIKGLSTALESVPAAPAPQEADAGGFALVPMPAVSEFGELPAPPQEYGRRIDELQREIGSLQNKLFLSGVPVVICFEGWDAAGKGGAIKRLTSALDARGYDVNPTASPTPDEKAHHFLWRFWRTLPDRGRIAVYDRTWYGRVMVERVEGFCAENDWKRAYREINEFEDVLVREGTLLLKFFINIDADCQLERFTERQNDADKRWKITDEDWRNREKWSAYETAINDMLRLTSTEAAPWSVIDGRCKQTARLTVLTETAQRMRAALK